MEYIYRVGPFGIKGICDVERHGNILVITQRDHQAASITNVIEYITFDLCKKFNISMREVIVFSRMPEFNNYTRVKFKVDHGRLCDPLWVDVEDDFIKEYIRIS